MLGWLIAALLVGAVVVSLTALTSWVDRQKTSQTDYGELVRERISEGNYTVYGSVRNVHGHRVASKTWERVTLDNDLNARFGKSDRIIT